MISTLGFCITAENHPPLLAPGNHSHQRLLHLIAREEQTAKGATNQGFQVFAVGRVGPRKFGDPVSQTGVTLKSSA